MCLTLSYQIASHYCVKGFRALLFPFYAILDFLVLRSGCYCGHNIIRRFSPDCRRIESKTMSTLILRFVQGWTRPFIWSSSSCV